MLDNLSTLFDKPKTRKRALKRFWLKVHNIKEHLKYAETSLTHLFPIYLFSTPWKQQKT